MVQCPRHHTPNAGRPGSIPSHGTRSHMPQLKIPRAAAKTQHSQIINKNKYFLKKIKEFRTQTYTEVKPCEDRGRTWPPSSQGEEPQKKPTLLTPWSWQSTSRMKKPFFVFLATQPMVPCYSSPGKIVHSVYFFATQGPCLSMQEKEVEGRCLWNISGVMC